MNRDGHLISSLLILVVIMGGIIVYYMGFSFIREILTVYYSVGFFLFGCILPDFDHPNVQKKLHIKWLGKITKHRGHFHSLIAMNVYGWLIFTFMFVTGFYYWMYPVIFGMGGFISHLIEDDLNRYKLKNKPKRGLKIW